MVLRITRRNKIDLAYGLALTLFLVVVVIAFVSIRSLRKSQIGVYQTEATLRRIASIPTTLKDAESAQRGYLLTRQELFLDRYHPVDGIVTAELQVIAAELAGDTSQTRRVETLRRLAAARMAAMDRALEAGRSGNIELGATLVGSGGGSGTDGLHRLCRGRDGEA
jgi:CHASE3 domain sensor protein